MCVKDSFEFTTGLILVFVPALLSCTAHPTDDSVADSVCGSVHQIFLHKVQ